MPAQIVHSIGSNYPFTLGMWLLSESDEALYHQWQSLGGCEQMPDIKATNRRREWLAARLLLHTLETGPVHFLPNGKPMLQEGGVSISHCGNYVAAVRCPDTIGVDIQMPTNQLAAIRQKFCSPAEWRWLEQHEELLRALTIVWSAKEAVFKYWGERVVFAEDMEVLPFRCSDKQLKLRYNGVHGTREFSLWHSTIESLEIVVAI